MFVALGCGFCISLLASLFGKFNRWLGRLVGLALLAAVVVYCNEGLVTYRQIRCESPHTIDLFRQLNREIPADKGLLSLKDIAGPGARAGTVSAYPVYAWYLDRDIAVANAWENATEWLDPRPNKLITDETVEAIQDQAEAGKYAYYHVPDVTDYTANLLFSQYRSHDLNRQLGKGNLKNPKAEALLTSQPRSDYEEAYSRKYIDYQKTLIDKLKKWYPYEYYDNPSTPTGEGFCFQGNTPCYLFDLTKPKLHRLGRRGLRQ